MTTTATRVALGDALKALGEENEKVIVFDGDVASATYTQTFGKAFPDRFYEMGIAEANMAGVAAGMSEFGFIPFVSTFAVFGTGRAYDRVRNTIAYGHYNVKLAMTHAGITGGPDGGSHQAIEDLALMRVIPGMTVLCPCDTAETHQAVRLAAEIEGPVYIRLSRMATPDYPEHPFTLGGSHVVREGKDAVIFTNGTMVSRSIDAAEILAAKGIDCAIVDLYSVKPIDEKRITEYAEKCGRVITVEEHSVIGGLGDAVSMVLGDVCVPMKRIGVQDKFGGSSKKPEELLAAYGLDGEGIAAQIEAWLK